MVGINWTLTSLNDAPACSKLSLGGRGIFSQVRAKSLKWVFDDRLVIKVTLNQKTIANFNFFQPWASSSEKSQVPRKLNLSFLFKTFSREIKKLLFENFSFYLSFAILRGIVL